MAMLSTTNQMSLTNNHITSSTISEGLENATIGKITILQNIANDNKLHSANQHTVLVQGEITHKFYELEK